MRKVFLICSFCILMSIALIGQESEAKDKSFMTITPTLKMNIFNYESLNNRLKTFNYPELSNSAFSLGTYINFGERTEKVFNTLYGGFLWNSSENNSYRTSMLIGEFFSNIEFNVLNKEKLFLHPFIGIGFITNQLLVSGKSINDSSFDAALSNLTGMTEIDSNDKLKWALNLGTGLDWRVSKDNDLYLGFVAGYRLLFSNLSWYRNGKALSGAPNINLSGAYFEINVTFS